MSSPVPILLESSQRENNAIIHLTQLLSEQSNDYWRLSFACDDVNRRCTPTGSLLSGSPLAPIILFIGNTTQYCDGTFEATAASLDQTQVITNVLYLCFNNRRTFFFDKTTFIISCAKQSSFVAIDSNYNFISQMCIIYNDYVIFSCQKSSEALIVIY